MENNIEYLIKRIEENANRIENNLERIQKNSYAIEILGDYKEGRDTLFEMFMTEHNNIGEMFKKQ